jgi:hypothetical protein
LKAWQDAQAYTKTETISADVITYDTAKKLFYATAEPGNEVVISQQSSQGQPATYNHSQAVRFNRETGESKVAEPREVQLVDAKTGVRPGLIPEPKDAKKPRQRQGVKIPGRATIERQNFYGR